ncbi:MAG: hypothetical protein ABI723_07085 [Bacteroidia bacterium]
MKTILLFILISCTLIFSDCKKSHDCGCVTYSSELIVLPTCISDKIEEIKNEPVWNPPAEVYQYHYNGSIVYYITSHCCDIPSILYDENCNVICNPDGGFVGTGDERCPDFFSKRKCEVLVWKDGG